MANFLHIFIEVYCMNDVSWFISKTNHSPQEFRETSTVVRFSKHVLQTSQIRDSELGFDLKHPVSSKFYSRSSRLIIPHKSFEKRRP